MQKNFMTNAWVLEIVNWFKYLETYMSNWSFSVHFWRGVIWFLRTCLRNLESLEQGKMQEGIFSGTFFCMQCLTTTFSKLVLLLTTQQIMKDLCSKQTHTFCFSGFMLMTSTHKKKIMSDKWENVNHLCLRFSATFVVVI